MYIGWFISGVHGGHIFQSTGRVWVPNHPTQVGQALQTANSTVLVEKQEGTKGH